MEGGESLRRMMMYDGNSGRARSMIMTGPHAAAELRTSNDRGFRKSSKPGKDLDMRDERVTFFQKSSLREYKMTNRALAASSSGFAVAYFITLCVGHRHHLERPIDVREFVCYRWVSCTELVSRSTEASHFGPD